MHKKSGFVVILGETNSGKSTFVNHILKVKVSITSHKVQTTRFSVLGIYTKGDSQVVFVDTPGIFNPRRDFDKAMIKHSYAQLGDADVVMFLLDAQKGVSENTAEIIKKIPANKKAILVINKIDLINKDKLALLVGELQQHLDVFSEIFMISALKGQHVNKLLDYLLEEMPFQEWYFNEEQISDLPLRKLAAEITREKIYKYLNKELPYNMIVEPSRWEEEDHRIEIYQTIYVVKDSHKKILLGKDGEKIKAIRISAMDDMTRGFGKKVSLFLYVKVDKHIFSKPEILQDMGLEA